MVKFFKAAIAALIALAVVAAAGTAIAQEDDTPPDEGGQEQQAPDGSQDDNAGGGHKFGQRFRNRAGRMLRGDVVVMDEDGKTKQVHFELGEASNVSDTGFTLTGADGIQTQVVLNGDTKFIPKDTNLSDLDGKTVRILAETRDGDAWLAAVVLVKQHNPRGDGGPSGGRPGEQPPSDDKGDDGGSNGGSNGGSKDDGSSNDGDGDSVVGVNTLTF